MIDKCAAEIRAWLRQRWKRSKLRVIACPLHLDAIRIVAVLIAAAEAQDAVSRCYRNTVSDGPRQFAGDLPVSVGSLQGVDGVIPSLRTAFPWLFVRKIRAASDNERALADAGEGVGKAFAVGN